MIVQRDGEESIKTSDLAKMHTTQFFNSKEVLARYVNDILTRSDPEEILQSITITRLERSVACYATAVTMYYLEGS